MRFPALLLIAMAVNAQTPAFPSRTVTDADLKIAVNNLQTTLRAAINTTATTLTVASSTGIVPSVLLTVDTEIMNVVGVSGTTITVTRAFDGTAAANHAYGAKVSAFIAAWHHNAVKEELKAVESYILTNAIEFTPQFPGGVLNVGPNTITLTPVPKGINGSNTNHWLWVSGGVGTPEACLIQGGTALSGSASGTVVINCTGVHSGAWSIETATGGIRESLQVARSAGGCVALNNPSYALRSTLAIEYNGACLQGNNIATTILTYSGSGTAVAVSSGGTIQDVKLSNLAVIGAGVGASANGILVTSGRFNVFEDVRVNSFTSGFVASSMSNSKIVRGEYLANGTNMQFVGASNANEVLSASIESASTRCLLMSGTGSGNAMRGGDLQSCAGDSAARIEAPANIIEGVWFQSNAGAGIHVVGVGASSTQITGNTFVDGLDAIKISNGQSNRIDSNYIPSQKIRIEVGASDTWIGRQRFFAIGNLIDNGIGTKVLEDSPVMTDFFESPNPFVQVPGGSISIGSNTITLNPVPRGMNGTDADHYVWISNGTGTAEACLITGGTAVSETATGTIVVTCANAHSGAWTVSSATAGIQEAISALPADGGTIHLGATRIFDLNASVVIRNKPVELNGDGALLRNLSTTTDAVQMRWSAPGTTSVQLVVRNLRIIAGTDDQSQSGLGSAGVGVLIDCANRRCLLDNTEIRNHQWAVKILINSFDSQVNRLVARWNARGSIYTRAGGFFSNSILYNCGVTGENPNSAAIWYENGGGLYANTIQTQCHNYGILISPSAITDLALYGLWINVAPDAAAKANIQFSGNGYAWTHTFTNTWSSFSEGHGVNLNNANTKNINFTGGLVRENRGHGFNIASGESISVNNMAITSNNRPLVTTLTAAIDAAVTSIDLASTSGVFVPSEVLIGAESLYCTALAGLTLSSCTRGYNSTAAAAHASGFTATVLNQYGVGVAINGALNNISIRGNRIGNVDAGNAFQQRAVDVSAGAGTGLIVSGNNMADNTIEGLRSMNSGTGSILAWNTPDSANYLRQVAVGYPVSGDRISVKDTTVFSMAGRAYSAVGSDRPFMVLGKAYGTPQAPAFVTTPFTELGQYTFATWTGGVSNEGMANTARMVGYSTEVHSATSFGSGIEFRIAPKGSAGSLGVMKLEELHVDFTGGATSVAANACGTTVQGTVTGSDATGSLTVGTVGVTSCVVSFQKTYTNAPKCIVSPTNSTGALATWITSTTTDFTLNSAVTMAGGTYNYHCFGI